MNNRSVRIGWLAALCCGLFVGPGGAFFDRAADAAQTQQASDVDGDLRAERDELIGKLLRGEDVDKSTERFAALVQTLHERIQEVNGLVEKEKANRLEQAAGRHDLDYVVGDKCQLSADPLKPPGGSGAFMHADWGPVIDKQPAVLKATRPFDDDEKITLYKVKGLVRTYTISSKGPALWFEKPLVANLGDLVLVCAVSVSSEGSGSRLPPGFRDGILSQGFAVPITEPPLIVQKQPQNPVHFVGKDNQFANLLRTGVLRKEYQDRSVVSRVLVRKSLGRVGDVYRYVLYASERDDFVLEVPPDLKNRQLLEPYHYAWVIMGKHRFDRELKQLVFVAEDIEPRYVTAK